LIFAVKQVILFPSTLLHA